MQTATMLKRRNDSAEPINNTVTTAPTMTLIDAPTPSDGLTPSSTGTVLETLRRTINYQQAKIDNLTKTVMLTEQQAQYDRDRPLSLHTFGQVAGEWVRMQPECLNDIMAMHTRLVIDHFLYQLVTDNEQAAPIIRDGLVGIACADICAIAGVEPPPLCNF